MLKLVKSNQNLWIEFELWMVGWAPAEQVATQTCGELSLAFHFLHLLLT